MAQLRKDLLCQHKDLSSIHSTCVKSWEWLCALVILVLRK